MCHRRWLSLILVLLVAGCGGKKSDVIAPLPAPPAMGALGSPRDLVRQASFADASQVRQATEFDAGIPTSRAYPDFKHPGYLNLLAMTTPSLTPAWAVYGFDLTGYDEEPLIKLIWSSNPQNDTVYLALANWSENHWDFVATDPSNVTLPDLAPYINANGKLLLAVITVDSLQHQLRWLAIGDAPGPAKPTVFGVNPRSSQPGTQMALIPQFTGTQPVTFDWQFGAGTDPASSTDANPTVTMGPEGDYDCTVTVTNKYGSDTYPFQIHSVIPAWITHSFGTSAKNKFVALETTWTDQSLVAGEMDNTRVSLFHFDKTGAPVSNLAYTGLPANRVTDMVLVNPDANDAETDRLTCYMAVYNDTGSGPGNAYIVRLDEDGSVMWYQPLGQGIPDVSRIDDNFYAASLARTDGKSVAVMGKSDGTIQWAKETVEDADYYCSAGAWSNDPTEGMFLAGKKDGKAAVMRIRTDGSLAWATQLSENIEIASCAYVQSAGVAISGTLPYEPVEKWTSFFLLMRQDTLLLGHEKFETDPIRPERVTYYDGRVFISGGTAVPSEARVYILDPLGGLYRGLKVEALNGVVLGDCRLTRMRPSIPGEMDPPEQPDEQVIFAGSSLTKDLSISTVPATLDTDWRPLITNINGDLQDATLPTEALTITPEEISTYTVDAPAGNLDGVYMRATNVF